MQTQAKSRQGIWIGALLGGALRGGLVVYHITPFTGVFVALIFALPSFGIGLLAGGVGGAASQPLHGAIRSMIISAGIFALFMLPIIWFFGLFGGGQKAGEFTLPFFVQDAVAGAIAGGVGAFAGSRKCQQNQSEQAPCA